MVPEGWVASDISRLFTRLRVTRTHDKKSCVTGGMTPILDQSSDGHFGYHAGSPEIHASPEEPIVTFANHTCATRLMTDSFSVIQNVFPFKAFPDVDPVFLFYALSDAVPQRGYRGHWPEVRRLILPKPPLPEQKKIAEILGSVDEAIQATQAVIDQTRKVKQGLLQQLLTRGIGHTRFKQTEIGEIPEPWEIGALGEFFELQRGFDITQKRVVKGSVPVVSSSGISYFHNAAMLQPPGVVTGRKGKLGDVYFLEIPYWPHDTSLWVRDFRGNDPRFVYWMLRGLRLESFDAATAVPTLNRNVVHRQIVGIPPIEEQRRISRILDESETCEASLDLQLKGEQSVKRGLMQDLLTGRVRVTTTS